MSFIIKIILQAIAVFLISTILFDALHFTLHQFLKSKNRILRKIGRLHLAHHRFYSINLQIEEQWLKKNLIRQVVIEYFTQMCGILLCLFFFDPIAVFLAGLFETCLFIGIYWVRGIDLHHQSYEKLPSYRGGLFVSADYHALHHIHPTKYFSGYIKLLDILLGKSHHITGKHIAMTGASGALGSHMKKLLEKEGAKITTFKYGVDYTYDNYDKLIEPLKKADILFLCHGTKYENAQQANCDSFVKIIELFKKVRVRKLVPAEVWAVGSEIECHPCFGIEKIKVYARSKRNFAREARKYFRDRDIQYRHLVHSAFISPMGPGLMTASFAAKVTLFLIKRGFRYVPVTYTGFAFLNYFRFIFNI